LFIHWNKQKLK